MGGLTRYAKKKILELFYQGKQTIALNKVYIALYTTEITVDGDGVEVSTTNTGYERQEATFGDVSIDSEGYSIVENTTEVNFGKATADYGTVTHVAVFDAKVGGNMISSSDNDDPKVILKGDNLRYAVGELVIGLN